MKRDISSTAITDYLINRKVTKKINTTNKALVYDFVLHENLKFSNNHIEIDMDVTNNPNE